MDRNLKIKFKILNVIEFEAEGIAEDVERERKEFLNEILPASIKTVTKAKIPVATEAEVGISESDYELLKENIVPELSVNEFLEKRGFKSQIDTAIGLIYYKQKYGDFDDFNLEELKKYFNEAKIPVPKNPRDTVSKLLKKAYIMNAESIGRYKLTRTGEQFIDSYKKIENSSKGTKRTKSKSTTKSAMTKETYQINKELDLLPKDRQTFKEFYEEKKPKTNIEFNVVAIYYLEKILEKKEIDINDIYTCYKAVGRRVSSALKQSLTDTSSSKYGYISTEKNHYSIPVVGENFVEYELPKQKGNK